MPQIAALTKQNIPYCTPYAFTYASAHGTNHLSHRRRVKITRVEMDDGAGCFGFGCPHAKFGTGRGLGMNDCAAAVCQWRSAVFSGLCVGKTGARTGVERKDGGYEGGRRGVGVYHCARGERGRTSAAAA